jgi:hypothetical protein
MRQRDPFKAMRVLETIFRFYEEGDHWTPGTRDDGKGKHCLVGAIELHCKHPGTVNDIIDYIGAAIWPHRQAEYYSLDRLMTFNDRCSGSERICAVLARARALARRDVERQPEIAAAKGVAAQKEEAAAARKRQLLAELERERMVRHAAGDTRETYILCPRVPEPHTEPQRLAA